MISLTNRQARRFILLKQGLLGDYRFAGKDGALQYIRQAGCIQFDPVDVCGKMAELTLQSRVRGFAKGMLDDLLYKDRALFDYPDKQLSILPAESWPYFERYRAAAREGGQKFEGLAALEAQALDYIGAHGPVSAEELPISGKLFWHSHIHWSGNWGGESNAARSVLEQLYSTGELIIHHKKGTRKYYDLAARYIPTALLCAPDPLPDDFEHQTWRVLRRIGAAGLLYDRPSGYWNNVWGLTAQSRQRAFRALTEEGKIAALSVEGMKSPLYFRTEDAPLMDEALSDNRLTPRCEFLAPLDPFLWDKQLIRAIFGFDYSWEIYTPDVKRKYGPYVLPMLYGEGFAGRAEMINDRETGTLLVKNIWYEPGVRQTKALKAAVDRRIGRFAKFNACSKVRYTEAAAGQTLQKG